MTVDFLVDWFATIGDFPILAFILAVIISGIPLFLLMALNAMVAVYAERKVSAFMMERIGPMGQGPGLHAGKWGLLQTVADAIKLLIKEDTIPQKSVKFLFKMAPFIIFIGAFLGLAAVPFSSSLQVADFNVGVFTNLTQDHLDYHKTMNEYFNAKSILFSQLNVKSSSVINIDDNYGKKIYKIYNTYPTAPLNTKTIQNYTWKVYYSYSRKCSHTHRQRYNYYESD